MSHPEAWFDDEAGPLVRPYAVTGGRTGVSRHDLELITLVVAVEAADQPIHESDYGRIVRTCAQPQSVAEIAAHTSLPLCVVKILISDLIDWNRVAISSGWSPSITVDLALMQKVLDGLRNL